MLSWCETLFPVYRLQKCSVVEVFYTATVKVFI